MLFSFLLPKPQDIQHTLAAIKQKAVSNGGKLIGDESSGIITCRGVEGRYTVGADSIEIAVLKKPSRIMPNAFIEKEIRKIFQSAS